MGKILCHQLCLVMVSATAVNESFLIYLGFEGESIDIRYNKGKLGEIKNCKDLIFYFSINIKQTHWLLRQKENSLHCPPGRT